MVVNELMREAMNRYPDDSRLRLEYLIALLVVEMHRQTEIMARQADATMELRKAAKDED